MRREQRQVALGTAAGLLVSGAVFYLGQTRLPPFVPVLMDPMERVMYAVGWLPLPALALAAGVARVALRRFFSAEAIDEDRAADALDIDRRYVQDTAEQLALAVPVHMAFAYRVAATSTRLVVVASLWFLCARVACWVGYHRTATARAFGFAATFYPTVALLAYCFYRMGS